MAERVACTEPAPFPPETDSRAFAMGELTDCIVIGAGPAGLTAATYLLRYRRTTLLLGQGPSRAALIKETRNLPGHPSGICGSALLSDLRRQLRQHGSGPVPARVQHISGARGGFAVHAGQQIYHARTVILCTGVRDHLPPHLNTPRHAVRAGCVRLCPICDAYEFAGAPICVLGSSEKAAREALFLRRYSPEVTLFTDGSPASAWSEELREQLRAADVQVDERPVLHISAQPARMTLAFRDGTSRVARALYVALGTRVRSELARGLGAETDDEGYLHVDRHQQTTVPGLYAAGDLVQSLSQIAVAFGQAAIAATAVHNSLGPHMNAREGEAETPARYQSDY